MRKREGLFFTFFVFFVLSLLVLFWGRNAVFAAPQGILQAVTLPFQKVTKNIFSISFGTSSQEQGFQEENVALRRKLVDQEKLKGDLQALSDQFQTSNQRNSDLLPADVVGSPGFVPGVTAPDFLVLDKGALDNVKQGEAVIFKDNAVGKIITVSPRLSVVQLLTNKESLVTAKTAENGSLGVVKGQGNGEMILDNVLLSDTLHIKDTVVTKGDINEKGVGFPPDLIVGKVVSVDKKASSLFQAAETLALLDFSKLTTVFIVIQ